ncbi:MAG: hypothetical protein WBX01_09510 [Nitrososphaeraceae archaeon]
MDGTNNGGNSVRGQAYSAKLSGPEVQVLAKSDALTVSTIRSGLFENAIGLSDALFISSVSAGALT